MKETSPEALPRLFKDRFGVVAAQQLGQQVQNTWPAFPRDRFVEIATTGLDELEFHGRIKQFSGALRETLPPDFREAIQLLIASLPPPLQNEEDLSCFWLQWPLGQFIADFGTDHFESSFEAMTALTQRHTSEFAVRPLLAMYPERAASRLLELTRHPSLHVRRWCSEGSRPRLPWGLRLRHFCSDPSLLWPILEALRDDPSLYVRRSVANHLNDIAKDHPAAVIARCGEWLADAPPGRRWIVGRALRSLVKEGHPEALKLQGYEAPQNLEVSFFIKPARIHVGETLSLEIGISSRSSQKQAVMVDFAVHFVRKEGRSSEKVFKGVTFELEARGTRTIVKALPIRTTTIRALYPGIHRVEARINGRTLAESQFELVTD
jgi:3-methyladenine DNA glycosylase AlkC